MRISAAVIVSFIPISLAVTSPGTHGSLVKPDVYEAIHQRESILAETLDTKNWGRLDESMAQDVIYDSRPLGPDYGGLSVGLQEVTENIKKAFGNAMVAHHVSNAIIRLNQDATKANVTT